MDQHLHSQQKNQQQQQQNQQEQEEVASLLSLSSLTSPQSKCQESSNNFFTFFQPKGWNIEQWEVLPPTRNNDWSFRTFINHVNYADSISLSNNVPHYYWQTGVPKEERQQIIPIEGNKNEKIRNDADQAEEEGDDESSSTNTEKKQSWSFISRDLPSFSSPDETFISFNPSEQKGIQCRFGERGVTAALHYDAGQNMIGMITGAKRYILSPPNQCPKFGIVTDRTHALYRHSILDFGRISTNAENDNDTVHDEEREWLRIAQTAVGIETIVKPGEVLYIPSYWFHYIISLQKSIQCNVRSGIDDDGGSTDETKKRNELFGTEHDISSEYCIHEKKEEELLESL